jgi:hypothetical protein
VRADAKDIKAAGVKVGSLDLPVSRSPKALLRVVGIAGRVPVFYFL